MNCVCIKMKDHLIHSLNQNKSIMYSSRPATVKVVLIPSIVALVISLVLVQWPLQVIADGVNPFKWFQRDAFDQIMIDMDKVSPENCKYMSEDELRLPYQALSNLPEYNKILLNTWYSNRTNLMHLHNMALNRAFFYSYILQKLNTSEVDFPILPGFLYYYYSASADISANPNGINGSSVLMDTNCTYPNWYPTVLKFNTTIPLFGPQAKRVDNYNDELNWLREPTNNTILIRDLGAGPDSNYTAPWYKNNPYIADKEMKIEFLPDNIRSDTDRKHQYDFTIAKADMYGNPITPREKRKFFGPTSPGVKETFQPVRFTRPYFDCGGTDRWMVTTVAPVVDFMWRYSNETRLRGPMIVGIVTMDLDFLHIDFNPCPAGLGNPEHKLSGTARCKLGTTMCEPLPNFGFYRGGYQCVCLPGYRYPFYQNGPFQGKDIEVATEDEYNVGFDCLRIQWQQERPQDNKVGVDLERKRRSVDSDRGWTAWMKGLGKTVVDKSMNLWNSVVSTKNTKPHLTSRGKFKASESEEQVNTNNNQTVHRPVKMSPRQPPSDVPKLTLPTVKGTKTISRFKRSLEYNGKLTNFDVERFEEVYEVFKKMEYISESTCGTAKAEDLSFPGEVGHGVEKQFEMQGRTALRTAHFLSAFYQNYVEKEIYGALTSDKRLNEHQLYGETLANVMADFMIYGSGIYFDWQMFKDENGTRRELFAPYSYAVAKKVQSVEAVDYSMKQYRNYVEQPFFKHLKERWASNTYGLERFLDKPYVRTDVNGTAQKKYDKYPIYYRAPRYEDGYWTKPYFDCNGMVKQWIITYAAPFFGRVDELESLEFMGVVTVSIPLKQLDINQCPSSFYTPNYFKNTAKCDFRSTYCVPIPGRQFIPGSYKCMCRQGYELAFNDKTWFFEGQYMEKQYKLKQKGEKNIFDMLVCREAGASGLSGSKLLLLAAGVVAFFSYTHY